MLDILWKNTENYQENTKITYWKNIYEKNIESIESNKQKSKNSKNKKWKPEVSAARDTIKNNCSWYN